MSGAIFATFGPAGGVGKTTVAINLAAALARELNACVALADLDFRFADVAAWLGVPAERSLVGLAKAGQPLVPREIEDYLYGHASGIAILPGCANLAQVRELQLERVKEVFGALQEAFDYVILDCEGRLNAFTSWALEMATRVVMVQATDLRTLIDAELVLDVLRVCKVPEERIKLVLNSPTPASVIEAKTAEDKLGVEVVCSIPYSLEIRASMNNKTPFLTSHPQCDAAKAIRLLAGNLVGGDGEKRRDW